MKLYVMNLERYRERRAHIEAQVARFDHEFVPTVDGRSLKREDWPDVQPLNMVAACLSHMNAYRAIQRDGRTGIVLEDDAILPDRLPDILLDDGVALLEYRSISSLGRCRLRGPGPLLEPLDPIQGGTAYAITPEACATLLDFHPAKRGLTPDSWWHFPVRVRCVQGRPASYRLDFPSTIGYRPGGRFIPNRLRTWNRKRNEREMTRFVVID